MSKTTRDRCPTWEVCKAASSAAARKAKGCHAVPECRLTEDLLDIGKARVAPTALYFAIARTRGKKWGAGARLGPLYLSSPLKHGKMEGNVSYRCVR